MKQCNDKHYPRLLQANWGWHPFYPSFIANPLYANFRPIYPLNYLVVQGWDVHALLLQQSHVQRIYHVPWSILYFVVSLNIIAYCPIWYHTLRPALLSPMLRNSWSSHKKLMEMVCVRGTWQPRTWERKVYSCLQVQGRWIHINSGLQRWMVVGGI